MVLPTSPLSFSPASSPTDLLLGAASSIQANNQAITNSNLLGNNIFNPSSVNTLLNTGQNDSRAILQSLIGFAGTNAPTIATSLGATNTNANTIGNTNLGTTNLGDTFGLSNANSALPFVASPTPTPTLNTSKPTANTQTTNAQGTPVLIDPVTGFTFVQTPQSIRTPSTTGLSQRSSQNAMAQLLNILPLAALFSSFFNQQAPTVTQPAPATVTTQPLATSTAPITKSTLVAPTTPAAPAKPVAATVAKPPAGVAVPPKVANADKAIGDLA